MAVERYLTGRSAFRQIIKCTRGRLLLVARDYRFDLDEKLFFH